jgi:ParB-like chromosome segregation protein Spo0J
MKPKIRSNKQEDAMTHSDAQVAQIASSIAAFGFNAPILVDSNAGVIAGHGRLLAARQLGLEEVPVIVLAPSPPYGSRGKAAQR